MALWSANGLTLGAYLARNRQRSAFAANLSIGARAAQTIMAGAAQNLIHVCNASRADTRSIAGLTTGAQDAAALGAAGASIGGPYGLAIGAAVGAVEGAFRGAWPTSREDFRHWFQNVLRACPDGVLMRLWSYIAQCAAVARAGDGTSPLGTWRTIDDRDINLFGSNQVVVAWMMEDLFACDGTHGWGRSFPNHPGPLDPRAAFDDCPWYWRYIVGMAASRYEDSTRPRDWGLLNNVIESGPNLDPFKVFVQPNFRDWVARFYASPLTAGDVRRSLMSLRKGAYLPMADSTVLPSDTATVVFLADPALGGH